MAQEMVPFSTGASKEVRVMICEDIILKENEICQREIRSSNRLHAPARGLHCIPGPARLYFGGSHGGDGAADGADCWLLRFDSFHEACRAANGGLYRRDGAGRIQNS